MLNSSKTFQNFREKTKNVVREASNGQSSPFERWSSDSLKSLLIAHNVQVRGSKHASHDTLVRICQDLFGDNYKGKENEFIKVYTMDEMIQMDNAARTIQWGYIDHRRRKNRPSGGPKVHNLVIDVIASPKHDSQEYVLQGRSKERRNSLYTIDDDDIEKGEITECRDEKEHGRDLREREDRDIEHNYHRSSRNLNDTHDGNKRKYKRYDEFDQSNMIDEDEERRISKNHPRQQQNFSKKRSSLYSDTRTEASSVSWSASRGKGYERRTDANGKETYDQTRKTEQKDGTNSSGKLKQHQVQKRSDNNVRKIEDDVPKNDRYRRSSSTKTYPPDHIDVVITTPRRRNSSMGGGGSETKSRAKSLEEELETKWIKPSWKLAKQFEAENRPHRSGKGMRPYEWRTVTLGRHCTVGGCGEQLDLWDEGQMSEFAQFGSGITNYFKFQKWCCWIMFILTILHIPALVLNTFGTAMVDDGGILALSTLGNLGSSEIKYVQIPGCDSSRYQFEICRLSKNQLALFYAFLDAIGTIVVIFGFHWLRIFEQSEVDHLNRSTVSASDYTLRVTGIPTNITEREIAAHFADVTACPIAEVNIAFKNADEIKMYIHRGQVMKKRVDCIQRIRYERSVGEHSNGGRKSNRRRLRQLLHQRNKWTSLVDLKDTKRTMKVNPNPDALQAFVTFDTEEGLVKAMSAYQMNWIRSTACFYPKRLRLNGTRINVSQAPEPSTIIWENIEVKESSRLSRKFLTTSIASLAIFLSIYFTFWARDFKLRTMQSMSGVCPSFFYDLSERDQYEMVMEDTTLSHCFCASLETQDQINESICRDFVKNQIRATSMSYGAGFMVCFMNMFFTFLMDQSGSFEKHQSLDDMESSNMTRLFILKFLNTGCLVLLYSLKFVQNMVRVKFEDPQNFNIDWYETGGVGMIIVMMINVISPHIGSLISYYKYKSRIWKLERNLTEDMDIDPKYKMFYTQDELNAVYLGPEFRLNYRYTQLLVNFYICWMYAISMPILPLIGSLSFFCSYWIDKFLFCNFYRIPPKYSDAMGSRSTMFIGYSIVLHLFMSCWILGNNQIFSGESMLESVNVDAVANLKIKEIIFKKHIVILEIIAAIFLAHALIKNLMDTFGTTVRKIMRCIFCSKGNEVKKLEAVMNTVQITYSGARARGVIKGLASYNILQNPKYQDAFAITPEFAQNHNRLSSIRGYNTKEKGEYNSDSESHCSSSDSEASA